MDRLAVADEGYEPATIKEHATASGKVLLILLLGAALAGAWGCASAVVEETEVEDEQHNPCYPRPEMLDPCLPIGKGSG